MINDSAKYTKEGATFASGAEAYESKNLLYGPELTAAINACYAKMLADGVLLEPITYSWDQETTTLTVTKIISSKEEYNAALTFDTALAVQRSSESGWAFVPAA